MHIRKLSASGSVLVLAGLLAGCSHTDSLPIREHAMGENVVLGPLTYDVIESNWYSQLGEGFNIRAPQQRFLSITLSITNGGGSDVPVPLLSLEGADGKMTTELDNGDGLDHWMGLIRNIAPAESLQGKILFDVPLASYKLRITDGGGPGAEKYGWVTIPLHIDADTGVQSPVPGSDVAK